MAEYSQAGILTAVLLFTAFTLRDVYLGKTSVQQHQDANSLDMEPDDLRETEPHKLAKQTLYTGPVLKFQYWVFEDYARAVSQVYPDVRIEGENYLPKPIYRYIASLISYFKFLLIALVASGYSIFPMLGMDPPRIWTWSQENKISSCLMVFFLSNMIETQCLSSGAFEITLNDVPIWSKLQSGHVPNIQEIFHILDNHLKMNQIDRTSFSTS
ncbi:SELT2 protein, partial [Polyodon spathula]|nr:SELT2 protein [Polyodon spathula]